MAQAARGSEQGQRACPPHCLRTALRAPSSVWDEGSEDVITEARPPEMTKWDNLPEAGTVRPAEVMRAKKSGTGRKKGRA